MKSVSEQRLIATPHARRNTALLHPLWVYARRMPKTIQVRDVPDDVHRRLTVRASEERRSLSELVRAELVEIARRPTMSEMLARLATRPPPAVPETPAEALARERLRG